jgi:hypothetical protein
MRTVSHRLGPFRLSDRVPGLPRGGSPRGGSPWPLFPSIARARPSPLTARPSGPARRPRRGFPCLAGARPGMRSCSRQSHRSPPRRRSSTLPRSTTQNPRPLTNPWGWDIAAVVTSLVQYRQILLRDGHRALFSQVNSGMDDMFRSSCGFGRLCRYRFMIARSCYRTRVGQRALPFRGRSQRRDMLAGVVQPRSS